MHFTKDKREHKMQSIYAWYMLEISIILIHWREELS